MNRFVFKLEPVLEYRERIEEICRKELAGALSRLDEEQEKLRLLKEVYQRSSVEADEIKARSSDVTEISLYCAYLTGLKGHIKEKEEIIVELKIEFEKSREKLVAASKEKKAVEIMKDRSREAHRQRADKEEQKVMDDIATTRFKRSV